MNECTLYCIILTFSSEEITCILSSATSTAFPRGGEKEITIYNSSLSLSPLLPSIASLSSLIFRAFPLRRNIPEVVGPSTHSLISISCSLSGSWLLIMRSSNGTPNILRERKRKYTCKSNNIKHHFSPSSFSSSYLTCLSDFFLNTRPIMPLLDDDRVPSCGGLRLTTNSSCCG